MAPYFWNPCLIEFGVYLFHLNRTFQSHYLEAVLLHQYFVVDNVEYPFRAIHALLSLRLAPQRLALYDYYRQAEDSYCPHCLSLAIYHYPVACAKLEG